MIAQYIVIIGRFKMSLKPVTSNAINANSEFRTYPTTRLAFPGFKLVFLPTRLMLVRGEEVEPTSIFSIG